MKHEHLDSLILHVVEKQSKKGGFTIDVLESGTTVMMETHNSIYQIKVVDGSKITIMGGVLADGTVRFPDPINAIFSGCTWGTSLLKPHWFGEGMRAEVMYKGGTITTSPIRNVQLYLPDGKELDLEWNVEKD